MRTDVNAVPHASPSKPPTVPGSNLKFEATKTYKHESGRRRQGDDGSRRSAELKRPKDPR